MHTTLIRPKTCTEKMGNSELIRAIIQGKKEKTIKTALKIIKQAKAYEIITESISKVFEIVGRKYETGEYFIPEMLRSARCAELSFNLVKPKIRLDKIGNDTGVVIGTVKGDIHDIGKNIIGSILASTGFIVHDLGVNVNPKQFVAKLNKTKSKILLLAALTSSASLAMKDVIVELKKNKIRDKVKVVIGGVSVNKKFAEEIGADFCGKTIKETLEYCKKLAS